MEQMHEQGQQHAEHEDPIRIESDVTPPREIVREVAFQLKSLPKVMPYEEYARIVHRVASLKWQYEQCDLSAPSSEADTDRPALR